jgi:hypothetical protein
MRKPLQGRRPSKRKTRENKIMCAEIKELFGVSGIHFRNSFGWTGPSSVTSCAINFDYLDPRDNWALITHPDALFKVLNRLEKPRISGYRRNRGEVVYQIVLYDPQEIRLNTLDDLKKYFLIKRLAGI